MSRALLFLCVILFSCSPKVNTIPLSSAKDSRLHLGHLPFVIIEKEKLDPSDVNLLGRIQIKDAGFTMTCDLESVKQLAKKEALKIGGNCYVITEHKPPNQVSTCHRIKADVHFIDNPRKYEKVIEWHEKRKLVIEDFKGSTENRPFQAVTASTFEYVIRTKTGLSKNYTITAKTIFSCLDSYFKQSASDSTVLAHEQIHFDISELYARKFLERMKAEAKTVKEALAIQDQVLQEVGRALQIKQDEYDSEVYEDPSKQLKWTNWVKEEISKMNAFKNKVISSKDF